MTVTLDLNNFVIDRDLLDENPRPAGYVLKNEGTLTITDSSWEKLGAITGGEISFNDSGKGGAASETMVPLSFPAAPLQEIWRRHAARVSGADTTSP